MNATTSITLSAVLGLALAAGAGAGPVAAGIPITVGTPTTGSLQAGDEQLRTGEYCDTYTFDGMQGEQISIRLDSTQFDPYLILFYPDGNQTDNDDYSSGLNAGFDLALPQAGSYRIVATSYRSGETGGYTLTVTRGGPPATTTTPGTTPPATGWGTTTTPPGPATTTPPPANAWGAPAVPATPTTPPPPTSWGTPVTPVTPATPVTPSTPGWGTPPATTTPTTPPPPATWGAPTTPTTPTTPPPTSWGTPTTPTTPVTPPPATSWGAPATPAIPTTPATPGWGTPTTPATPTLPTTPTMPPAPTTNSGGGPLTPGVPMSGVLTAGDSQLTSGEYFDEYALQGAAGQTLTLTLNSTAFDPYLIVVHPDGQQTENDDMAQGNVNSQVILALPSAGAYRVLVTTYAPGESGAYTLTAN